MLAIVPVKGLEGAKSRLSPLLSPAERARLVRSMLDGVLAACAEASAVDATLVVTPDPGLAPAGVALLVDEGTGHGPALAAALADPRARGGVLVVMADCPLASPESLDRLAAAARPAALVPAADGGMNAVALCRAGLFEPAFGVPGSAETTIERARAAGIEPAIVEDPLLALDVDRPSDLEALQASILS